MLLKPVFLAATRQFDLNIAVSLAIFRMLSACFPGKIALKWPNDLYYQDQKMGGILIENTVKGTNLAQSVAGIGLNVNQLEFAHPRAVSMRSIAKQPFVLEEILNELLEQLELLTCNSAPAAEELRKAYLNALYARDQRKLFRVGEEIREGTIRGVDSTGRLLVEMEHESRSFSFREIAFVWSRGKE